MTYNSPIIFTYIISYIFRIAIRMESSHVMIMFDYIISEKQIVKDQSHHFHTIEFLEVVFYLNLNVLNKLFNFYLK